VGLALLRACFDDLMLTPARRLFLEVAADNPAAMTLYRKLGFANLSERHGYYPRPDGRPATAIVMARDLG
jgi:[ribosomal protein S18]-alanine N-acetyltransferase